MVKEARSLFDLTEYPCSPDMTPAPQPGRRVHAAKKTISDLLFQEAIAAVKESVGCQDLKELQTRLVSALGQNSQQTRLRYSRSVLLWFFPDGLDGIARKTWLAYQDEKILTDILRYLYLEHEPVMGACVAECLFPLENGMRLPAAVFDRFLTNYYGGDQTKKTSQRLKTNLMRLGMLERCAGEDDRLISVNPSKSSVLLLVHYLFAAAGPRTIELRNLVANPFWKYVGLKAEDDVRMILREADAAGAVGKYVVADQLEQVTTCLTLDELLAKKVRL